MFGINYVSNPPPEAAIDQRPDMAARGTLEQGKSFWIGAAVFSFGLRNGLMLDGINFF